MTGFARGSASATEPLGGPGTGRRGSRIPAAGGRRHRPRPRPPARSSSHLAGAVSAIHSGLVTKSISKRRRRHESRSLSVRPPASRAARAPGLERRGVRCQPGWAGRATGQPTTYRRSGSPSTTTSGDKTTVSSQMLAVRRNRHMARPRLIPSLCPNPPAVTAPPNHNSTR